MKKLNRHIKAGAIAGFVLCMAFVLLIHPSFRFFPLPEMLFVYMGCPLAGLLAGAVAGALIWGIEKLISKRLWLILSILPALAAGIFISFLFLARFVFGQ